MPNYKDSSRHPKWIPVVVEEQILPGSFEFALDHLVDHELDLSALDAKFKNDKTGASAYDPRVMLKIVLLAYSRGLISSRDIEHACKTNVQFIAISGDSHPSYTHIAKFVRELVDQIKPLFTQVLMICDAQGLIGKQMFAIDGVKLSSNASKERSGTHAELVHRSKRLDKAAAKILERHQTQDGKGNDETLPRKAQVQRDKLQREAQRMREFVSSNAPRRNAKGVELKSNATDNDSAKMATSKGVIQGYAAQAAVDSKHQIIVAADVLGSGSEQGALIGMVQLTQAIGLDDTLITADAGYHSEKNLETLRELGVPAMIADNQMRQRDERFADRARHKGRADPLHQKRPIDEPDKPKLFEAKDFTVELHLNRCRCPAGKLMYASGKAITTNGYVHDRWRGTITGCRDCHLRAQCIRKPEQSQVRQVSFFYPDQASPKKATEIMRRAIDSPEGRYLYSQRFGTVEPVFANIRHTKRLNRFTLRTKPKVNTQWQLYCLVHNVEKIANVGSKTE
jgi:transposase